MKTKTVKAPAPMVGRRVKLTFPNYDTDSMAKSYPNTTRPEIMKECLGHTSGAIWRLKYLDQEAEIVNVRNDEGFIYSMAFADGTIQEGYAHDFVVLPVSPEKPIKFEYKVEVCGARGDANRDEMLATCGAEGWELVAVTSPNASHSARAYFKRELSQ